MTDRLSTPSKIPRIPKRHPSRPNLTRLPLRKRQPDRQSLRHDVRSDEVKSKDNDRKRRGRIYLEDLESCSLNNKEEPEAGGNIGRIQGLDNGYESKVSLVDSDGDSTANVPFEAPGPTDSSDLYDPGQQADSAVDLSVSTPGLDGSFDLSNIRRSLLPKPRSLRPKLSISTTQKNIGRTIPRLSSTDATEPPSNGRDKIIPSLNPAARSFIPYSASEYSDDNIGEDEGPKKTTTKTKRTNDDPRKYNHNIDWYLDTEEFDVKPGKSTKSPGLKDLIVSSPGIDEMETLNKDSSTNSLDNINGYEITFNKSNEDVVKSASPKEQVTDSICGLM
ncbi:hypothetical protein BKA65DRAFT_547783 [Rhexocercosporidium sp. MPI-PUGE-AT-0058]|nr:hypothetical protein BKA65DRAFT_547783 [Rhexocercosporidium sp. MPI-PUGE-AT-0058]